MGSAATYMNVMALLQCVSLVIPERAASRLERGLYSSYQRMVAFWFETWSGVEVGGDGAWFVRSTVHILLFFSFASMATDCQSPQRMPSTSPTINVPVSVSQG